MTTNFLTEALRSGGALGSASVRDVVVEPLTGSFNAQITRLYLQYEDGATDAPRSLIAKLPTADTELHEYAAVFRPGVAENWFYEQGAARTPVAVPRCYYRAVHDTKQSILLLEDLAPAQSGKQIAGVSHEEAILPLLAAAALHAAWWNGADRPEIQELRRLQGSSQEAQGLVDGFYRAAWPSFMARNREEIPLEVARFGERLVGRIAEAEALLQIAPQTLIHGDFRLDNMLFGTRDGVPTCWVIDWEDILLWCGMFDVAWFLAGNLRVEERAQEEALLGIYHRALQSHGVTDYSWESCLRDYRAAMISAFVQGVLMASADDLPADAAHLLTERFVSACQRWRLWELLPA